MRRLASIWVLYTLAIATPAVAADPQLGRNLAATCAPCHGPDGKAQGAMIPLAGRPADNLLSLLRAFKAGQREVTIMHQIVKGYTDEQLQLVAEYFAKQP